MVINKNFIKKKTRQKQSNNIEHPLNGYENYKQTKHTKQHNRQTDNCKY